MSPWARHFLCHRQLTELLLGQPAPAGGVAAAIARRGAVGLHGTGIGVAGRGGLSEPFERLAVVVESFGIVGTALGIDRQFVARIGILARRDVDAAEFAQRFKIGRASCRERV